MRFEATSNRTLSKITEELIEKLGDRLGPGIIQQLQEQSPSFTSLDLSSKQLDDEDVSLLAEFLKLNTTLRELNLSHNKIGALGAEYLAQALEVNRALIILSLSGNKIRDLGAKHLAQMLKTNKTLRELNLGFSEIQVLGAKYLGQALEINGALTTLNLSSNNISDEGANYFAQALEINATLEILYLWRNNIGDLGEKRLGQALETNTILMNLFLGDKVACMERRNEKLERNKRQLLRPYYQACMLLRLGSSDRHSTFALLDLNVINLLCFWITLPFQKTEVAKLYQLPNIEPLRSQALLTSVFLPDFSVQIKNKILARFPMSALSVLCIPKEGISLSLTINGLTPAVITFVEHVQALSSKITSNKQTGELLLLINDRRALQYFLTDLGFSEKQSTEFFEDYRIKEFVPEIPREDCLVM